MSSQKSPKTPNQSNEADLQNKIATLEDYYEQRTDELFALHDQIKSSKRGRDSLVTEVDRLSRQESDLKESVGTLLSTEQAANEGLSEARAKTIAANDRANALAKEIKDLEARAGQMKQELVKSREDMDAERAEIVASKQRLDDFEATLRRREIKVII